MLFRSRKFLVGLVKSFDFVTNHEMEARKHLPKYTKVPEDMCMICALRELQPAEPLSRLEDQHRLMVRYGFMKEMQDISTMIDYSYLPEGSH